MVAGSSRGGRPLAGVFWALAGLGLLLGGCRTHPEMIREARRRIAAGDVSGAVAVFPREIDPAGRNGVLYLCERARLNHDLGDYAASNRDIVAVQEHERRREESEARIKLSTGGSQAAAALTSDEVLPYRLGDFERVMLYQTAGFNFLHADPRSLPAVVNLLDGLQDGLRRSSGRKDSDLEQEIGRLSDRRARRSLRELRDSRVFREQERSSEAIVRGLPGFENAYTYYFCGLFHEAQDDLGSALLAYRFAFALHPGNGLFRRTLARTALLCGRNDLLEKYHLPAVPADRADGRGEIVVFFEGGWVPARQACKLTVPVYTDATGFVLIPLAFPCYPETGGRKPALDLSIDGRALPAEEAADVFRFAVKQLRDRMPGIVVRMFLRASARTLAAAAANCAAARIEDDGARLLAQLASLAAQAGLAEMEQPDLRSFLSLPRTLQIARASAPPGRHRLRIECYGRRQDLDVELKAGGKKVVQIVATPEFLNVFQTDMPNLGKLFRL